MLLILWLILAIFCPIIILLINKIFGDFCILKYMRKVFGNYGLYKCKLLILFFVIVMAGITYSVIQYPGFHKYFRYDQPKLELATLPQNILLMNNLPNDIDYRHYFDLFDVRVGVYSWGRIAVLNKYCGSILDWKSLRLWRLFFEQIVGIENISRKDGLDLFIGGLTGMAYQSARRFIHGNNDYMNHPIIYNKSYEEVINFMEQQFH